MGARERMQSSTESSVCENRVQRPVLSCLSYACVLVNGSKRPIFLRRRVTKTTVEAAVSGVALHAAVHSETLAARRSVEQTRRHCAIRGLRPKRCERRTQEPPRIPVQSTERKRASSDSPWVVDRERLVDCLHPLCMPAFVSQRNLHFFPRNLKRPLGPNYPSSLFVLYSRRKSNTIG